MPPCDTGENGWLEMNLPGLAAAPRRIVGLVVATVISCVGPAAVSAAVLKVGPGQTYSQPSAAIAAAHDGDSVLIAPGTYYDCAIVHANDLTIAGVAGDAAAVLTDKTCAGKALLVIDGHNITIRNLTLARARVAAGNGAGIRAEGHNLTVDHVRFINDEDGILAAADPTGTITVRDSVFHRNGECDPHCGYGIEVGSLRRLRVTHSDFAQASGGVHIASAAQVTELVGNQLTDDGRKMTGPMVWIHGGGLMASDNIFTLALGAERLPGAMLITGDTTRISVQGNILREAAGEHVPLLRNWTGQSVVAADNVVPPGGTAVSDDGALYHRLRARAAALRDSLLSLAGDAKHILAVVLRRLM